MKVSNSDSSSLILKDLINIIFDCKKDNSTDIQVINQNFIVQLLFRYS
jgi:hypothetical protein